MKDFELDIIKDLIKSSNLKAMDINEVKFNSNIEYSGAGYFINIKSSQLPKERVVLDKPNINGNLGGIEVGYIAFVENHELMLECYSYDQEITPLHRDKEFSRNET